MRRTHILSLFLITLCASYAVPCAAMAGDKVHRAAPVGSYGGLMNPDVSAVVDLWGLLSDNGGNPLRDRLNIRETELAFQAYLYPGIRGDLIIALHEHDHESEVHPEEAFVSFLDLPLGFQLLAGRKLMNFGRLNSQHPHHWKFAAQPLVLDNFFGDHPFFDDGVQADWLLPNPWDLYCNLTFGRWTGGTLGHEHESDGDDEGAHSPQTLRWRGAIYNGRATLDLPAGEISNIFLGYSIVWDEGRNSYLHGADMTLTYRSSMSYKRLKWQSELFYAETEEEHTPNPYGLYSMLSLTWNQYWEFGARYDRSEFFHQEQEQEEGQYKKNYEWGITGFLTYYFTHSLYLRCEYAYSIDRFEVEENRFIGQIVWGLGPHAHRLEN